MKLLFFFLNFVQDICLDCNPPPDIFDFLNIAFSLSIIISLLANILQGILKKIRSKAIEFNLKKNHIIFAILSGTLPILYILFFIEQGVLKEKVESFYPILFIFSFLTYAFNSYVLYRLDKMEKLETLKVKSYVELVPKFIEMLVIIIIIIINLKYTLMGINTAIESSPTLFYFLLSRI